MLTAAKIMTDQDTATGPTLAYSRTQRRSQLREATDRELLWALREGEEMALDELVERKTNPLIQLAYRILGDAEEARDIVQVTLKPGRFLYLPPENG